MILKEKALVSILEKILAETNKPTLQPQISRENVPGGSGNKYLDEATSTSPGVFYFSNPDDVNAMLKLLKGEGTSFGQELERLGIDVLNARGPFQGLVDNLNTGNNGALGGNNFVWADIFSAGTDNPDDSNRIYEFGSTMVSAKATLVKNKDPLDGNQPKQDNLVEMAKAIAKHLEDPANGVNLADYDDLLLKCGVAAFKPMFVEGSGTNTANILDQRYSSLVRTALESEFPNTAPEEVLARTTPVLMQYVVPQNHNIRISHRDNYERPSPYDVSVKKSESFASSLGINNFSRSVFNGSKLKSLFDSFKDELPANFKVKNTDIANDLNFSGLSIANDNVKSDALAFLFKTVFTSNPPTKVGDFTGGFPTSGINRGKDKLEEYISELMGYGSFTKTSDAGTFYDLKYEFNDAGYKAFRIKYLGTMAGDKRSASSSATNSLKTIYNNTATITDAQKAQIPARLKSLDLNSKETSRGTFVISKMPGKDPKLTIGEYVAAAMRCFLGKRFEVLGLNNPGTTAPQSLTQVGTKTNLSEITVRANRYVGLSMQTGVPVAKPNSVNVFKQQYGGAYDTYEVVILLAGISPDSPELRTGATYSPSSAAASSPGGGLIEKDLLTELNKVKAELDRLSRNQSDLQKIYDSARFDEDNRNKLQKLILLLDRFYPTQLSNLLDSTEFLALVETVNDDNKTNIERGTALDNIVDALDTYYQQLDTQTNSILQHVLGVMDTVTTTSESIVDSYSSFKIIIDKINDSLVALNSSLTQIIGSLKGRGPSQQSVVAPGVLSQAQPTRSLFDNQLQLDSMSESSYENIIKNLLYSAKKKQ